MSQVVAKANEWGSQIPIGVFYQNEHVPTYEERIAAKIEHYGRNPPAKQVIDKDGKPAADISKLLNDQRVSNI